MAIRHVIAYAMHENEIDAARNALGNSRATDSYVIGDIDESQIAGLEEQGLIVDDITETGRPVTAAVARGSLAAQTGLDGWRAGPDDGIPAPEPELVTQWVVSIDGPLLAELRTAIHDTGMSLEEYLPEHSYVSSGTPEQATECINLPFVRDVVRYGPSITGPIVLQSQDDADRGPGAPAGGRVWDLWLRDETARETVTAWLEQHGVLLVGAGGRKVRIELPPDPELQRDVSILPGVLSMVEHVPPQLFNNVARGLIGLDPPAPGQEIPLTGKGQVVAVADTGLMADHPDFKGRIVGVVALGRPGDSSDPHGHGTHVAGSVLADGASSAGRYRGVAPQAELYFQSLLDRAGGLGGIPVSLHDLFEPAYQAGARIHNNSWGAATASAYTIDSTDVDSYISDRRDMLVVIAAGNEGTSAEPFNANPGFVDWLSIGSPASCKNALTVGAARSSRTSGGLAGRPYGKVWAAKYPQPPIAEQHVSGDPECLAAFSSRGPCDDRRMKPDVVAPGTDIISVRSNRAPDRSFWGLVAENPAYAYMGGTSMACPLVAGFAALVREYYVSVRTANPSAALLKATIVNGTRWLSGADSVADHQGRPNYHQGFGAVFLPTTIPNANEPTLTLEYIDTWTTPALQFQETGQRFRFRVDVTSGLPLRICLAYTDLPGRSLQNDVSLIVEEPSGRKQVGNADLPSSLTRSDVDNNVEVLRVDEPESGVWTIQVFARNLLRPPQDFALVVTGELASALRRAPG